MKNRFGLVLSAFFFKFFFVVQASSSEVVIEHDLGVTQLKNKPTRIVALETNYIDALASVGIAPVGIADDNSRHRVTDAYTDVIGDDWISVGYRKTPNLETIASLRPDLILADTSRHTSVYPMLSKIAPTVVFNCLSGGYNETLGVFKKVAKAVGKEEKMNQRIASHNMKMQAYRKKLAPKKHLTVQFGVSNANNVWLHSPVSYNATLLQELGLKSGMSSDTKTAYVKVSLEQLSQVNPDVLLISTYSRPSQIDKWSDERAFQEITAAKKGQVIFVNRPNQWARHRGLIAAEMKAQDVVRVISEISEGENP